MGGVMKVCDFHEQKIVGEAVKVKQSRVNSFVRRTHDDSV